MSSFLGLILERIEYDTFERLIEEGKDPRELLHNKFKNVPSDIIDKVISIDPTKKKSYSQWLLSHWDDESDTIVKNLKNGRIEQLFKFVKGSNDVQIKDFGSVGAPLQEFIPEVEDDEEEEEEGEKLHNILTKSSAPTTILHNNGWTKQVPSELANDFDIVFNEDDWIIAVPNTYEADCKLGENMYWCTAGGRTSYETGRKYFDEYLQSGGKYYVNFDLTQSESRLGVDYPFTRYQFHFESKQFMDKEDDPVCPGEIGMPDSAMDFYIDHEGYSEEDFENEEERWNRYNEQRYESYYRVADELYLNIQYDDGYEWEEPQADTDFYLFDEDDDRDPLEWEEIANPFVNDDIFLINDEEHGLFVLKTKYGDEDDFLLAIKDSTVRWREWDGHKIKKCLQLPNNLGVFAIGRDYREENKYIFYSHHGVVSYYYLNGKNCENIFINEQCTNADKDTGWSAIFVETVQDGYHSLFMIKGVESDMICVVKRDEPINGEYFTINEQGLIEGQFRKYRIYGDDTYEQDDTYHNYDLEQELSNGNYVISTIVKVDRYNASEKYEQQLNILKRGSSTPLLPVWFDRFIGYGQGLYLIAKNKYRTIYDHNDQPIGTTESEWFAYFDENGQQIGEWYEKYHLLDSRGYCIGQNEKESVKCDLISAKDNAVIGTFKQLSTMMPVDDKILVICDDDVTRGFDYVKKQFCYPQFSTMRRIASYYSCFLCDLSDGSNSKVLFDFERQQIMATNIAEIDWLARIDDIFKLTKTDGKFNAYDAERGKTLLPNDVDSIEWVGGCILYGLNNMYYLYHVKDNKMELNPNGFNIPFETNDAYGYIAFGDGQYRLVFKVSKYDGCHFSKWVDMTTKQQYFELGSNPPQEVLDMYCQLTNKRPPQPQQTPQEDPSYAVAEQFKRFVNRINEAEKLRYNEIID